MTTPDACAVCGVTIQAARQLFRCHDCRTRLCVQHLAGWRLADGSRVERVPLCLACLQPTDIPLATDDRQHEQHLIDQWARRRRPRRRTT